MSFLFKRLIYYTISDFWNILDAIGTLVTIAKSIISKKVEWLFVALILVVILLVKFGVDVGYYIGPDKEAFYCEDTGHYYKAYNKSISWEDADEKCRELGGHLATVTSQGEYDFIASICKDKAFYWLGGHRVGDTYKWVTDEIWDFGKPHHKPWLQGQPDNKSGIDGTDGQFYLSYEPIADGWDDKQLNGDNTGENSVRDGGAGYVCEWE